MNAGKNNPGCKVYIPENNQIRGGGKIHTPDFLREYSILGRTFYK